MTVTRPTRTSEASNYENEDVVYEETQYTATHRIITKTVRIHNGGITYLRSYTTRARLNAQQLQRHNDLTIDSITPNSIRFITTRPSSDVENSNVGNDIQQEPPIMHPVESLETQVNTVQHSSTPRVVKLSTHNLRTSRRHNRSGLQLATSESDLFKEIMEQGVGLFHILQQDSSNMQSRIRAAQICYEKRTFSLLTARIEPATENVLNASHLVGGITWQVSLKPPRAICITIRHGFLGDPTPSTEVVCSCNPSLVVNYNNEQVTSCFHIQHTINNSSVGNLFTTVLQSEFQGVRGLSHFGPRFRRGTDSEILQLLRHNQIDDNSFRNNWNFLVSFDMETVMFVPLLKMKHRKIQCLMCRGLRTRRGPCSHEISSDKRGVPRTEVEIYNEHQLEDDEDMEFAETAEHVDVNSAPNEQPSSSKTETEKYNISNVRLPLLPCSGIRTETIALSLQIDQSKGQETIRITDRFGICQHCGYNRKASSVRTHQYRTVRLYTLNQQIPIVEVEDWICPGCQKVVFFFGIGKALFPTRKTYVYTYELLYHFVQNVCRLGISFRAQYDSWNMQSTSDSARARFDHFSDNRTLLSTDLDDSKSGRRRAAEALHLFIKLIDTSNSDLCSKLFTCPDCEVPLTKTDQQQLGLFNKDIGNIKRFKALVVDGTAAGILHSLPTYERSPIYMTVPSRLRKDSKLFTNRMFQMALQTLISLSRARLRTIITGRKNLPTSDTQLSFILPPSSSPTQSKRHKGGVKLSTESIACLRYLLLGHTCFCHSGMDTDHVTQRGEDRTHNSLCNKINKAITTSIKGTDCMKLLKVFFSMQAKSSETETPGEEEAIETDNDQEPESDS